MLNLEYTMKSVTCHTEGCENQDIAIVVPLVDGGNVVCGVCGNEITDIQEVE
jgi:hypothetical protein